MLITNQCVAQNYCLINSVINTLLGLLKWVFIPHVIKAKTLWKIQREELLPSLFTNQGRKLFPVKRNLFIQKNICEGAIKKRNNKIL